MGPEVFGTIEAAIGCMISDGGTTTKDALVKELELICDNQDYTEWLKKERYNIETIKFVGGRFLMPEDVAKLLNSLTNKG